ncbi:MAG: DUF1289 domain-containing protein [Polynucleobacter sp.]|nr:DUF1289 domain-containing protein [Polynucleobacter sp.]
MAQSPCINWCEMNPKSGYCLGCYRTINEIASWSSLSEEQQLAILAQIDDRKNASDKKPRLSL